MGLCKIPSNFFNKISLLEKNKMVLFHVCKNCDGTHSRVFIIVSNYSPKNSYTLEDSIYLTENAKCQRYYKDPVSAYSDCLKFQIASPKSFYGVALIIVEE